MRRGGNRHAGDPSPPPLMLGKPLGLFLLSRGPSVARKRLGNSDDVPSTSSWVGAVAENDSPPRHFLLRSVLDESLAAVAIPSPFSVCTAVTGQWLDLVDGEE
jgi:hypothetical protein